MTLRKLIENMTVASNPSWTTRWIIFIAGWWRSSWMVISISSAIIPTRVPRATAEAESSSSAKLLAGSRVPCAWRVAGALLTAFLCLGGSPEAWGQTHHKRKKSGRPKPVPCRSGCTPDTTVLEIVAATADDEAAQRELSILARALRNAAPGSFDRLSAFAKTNAGNVWGARAALALGFDEYNKNHGSQALAWFTKAKGDAVLSDYVSFWTGQTLRLLKRNAEALAALEEV